MNCNAGRTTTQRMPVQGPKNQQNVPAKSRRGKRGKKKKQKRAGEQTQKNAIGAGTVSCRAEQLYAISSMSNYRVSTARRLAWSRCRSPHAPGPVKFIACLVSGYSADYHQSQEVCVYVRRGACFCSPSVSRTDAQLGCSIVQSGRGQLPTNCT